MSTSEPPPSFPPSAARVLYVDDEPALRHAITELLQRHGYVVDTATDGVDGWLKVIDQKSPFDLVITDRQMPRMDGLSFVRKLRQASFAGRIIVFSAALTPRCVAEFETLAVDALIPKGTPAAALVSAIAQVAAGRRSPPKTVPRERHP